MQDQLQIQNNKPAEAAEEIKKPEMLSVSISPHIFSKRTTQSIMRDVLIALAPALIAGCIIFGPRALFVTAVCIAASVLSELLFNLVCKKEQSVGDLSAAVTGLLLALNLPVDIPIWQAVIGSVFAIIFVKCLFGGIGQNFANPAITARVFMLIAFESMLSVSLPTIVDTAASASPLPLLKGGEALPSLLDMLLGVHGGAIGETCSIALLIGGVYLICKKIISWHTPVAFIGTVFLFTLAVKGDALFSLYHVLAGGVILGAIFMATDYATTPTTPMGRAVFGIGCGLITVVIRLWGNSPEGVSFAILFMNILTPYIDKLTARKTFGERRAKNEK